MSKETIATLKQGICAYNYGNYVEALAHFQSVAHNAVEPMMQDQAKKNLIKTYRKLGRIEEAIELCQSFLGHNIYHVWAVKTLEKLGVNPLENTLNELDSELSAPLLPPELEAKHQHQSVYSQLIDSLKRWFQGQSWERFFRIFGQS